MNQYSLYWLKLEYSIPFYEYGCLTLSFMVILEEHWYHSFQLHQWAIHEYQVTRRYIRAPILVHILSTTYYLIADIITISTSYGYCTITGVKFKE